MNQNLGWALAGAVGGGLFLLFLFVIAPESLLLAGGVGLAGLAAGWLIFVRSGREKGLPGVGADQAERLRSGWDLHRQLLAQAKRAPNQAVRAKIQGIAEVVGRILEDLKADPSDFAKAGQFLDYYLVATVAVVGKYLDLLGKTASGEGMGAIRQTETTLDTVRLSFEKLYQQLLENEVMDLGVELKVLNSTLNMEGLAGPDLQLPSAKAGQTQH